MSGYVVQCGKALSMRQVVSELNERNNLIMFCYGRLWMVQLIMEVSS